MTNAYPSNVSESTHTHASPSAGAYFHRTPQEVAARAKNATAANISGGFRQPAEQNNARKLTELTMPLSAWKPSLTGNTWSFLSAISASCRESRRKSVNKKQSRFNAAVLLSSSRLSGVFASVSWAGGDVTDGLTVANTSLNQFKKKKKLEH